MLLTCDGRLTRTLGLPTRELVRPASGAIGPWSYLPDRVTYPFRNG